MKRWICCILTVIMLLGLCPAAMAEEAPVYQLGDKMEDFALTLSDGTEVTLYGLLAEKKAVLLNFWASWCGPCAREFPFMQKAYDKYQEDVGILALSIEPNDSNENILALRERFGISTIPVGRDTEGLNQRFEVANYPTSVMIDRNGVVCFILRMSMPDPASFERVVDVYLAEDYTDPVLLEELPPDPGPEKRPAEELQSALGITDAQITVSNSEKIGVWPFYAAEDGSYVRSSNDARQCNTLSGFVVTVTAQAGQTLAYDYRVVGGYDYVDSLRIYVDEKPVRLHSTEPEWQTGYVTFETAGEHTLNIYFRRTEALTGTVDAEADMANMRMISVEETAALKAAEPVYPKTLEGAAIEIEVLEGEFREARIHDATGELDRTLDVLQGSNLSLRIRVGKDIDPAQAYMQFNGDSFLLCHLPYDEEGFLVQHAAADTPKYSQLFAYNILSIFPDVFADPGQSTALLFWADTEVMVDNYTAELKEYYDNKWAKDLVVSWEYTDGMPKQNSESTGSAAAPAPSDGTARYEFTVQDSAGAPVAGVMLQVCDDSTCAVAVTDENGQATHEAARYPYEIHVLKAPEGYAADATTYTMPEEGGSLIITLQKQ